MGRCGLESRGERRPAAWRQAGGPSGLKAGSGPSPAGARRAARTCTTSAAGEPKLLSSPRLALSRLRASRGAGGRGGRQGVGTRARPGCCARSGALAPGPAGISILLAAGAYHSRSPSAGALHLLRAASASAMTGSAAARSRVHSSWKFCTSDCGGRRMAGGGAYARWRSTCGWGWQGMGAPRPAAGVTHAGGTSRTSGKHHRSPARQQRPPARQPRTCSDAAASSSPRLASTASSTTAFSRPMLTISSSVAAFFSSTMIWRVRGRCKGVRGACEVGRGGCGGGCGPQMFRFS